MTTEAAVYDALKYYVKVDQNGTRRYYNSAGRLHRTDGPAVEHANGTKEWCQNGLRHRLDGPAIEYANGYQEWWLNGKRYTKQDYHAQLKALGHTV
jgi:hypothetical protein